MLRSTKHRALLVALTIFGLLVAFTGEKPEYAEDTASRYTPWQLQLELRADLSPFAEDFVAVQDTFSHYLSEYTRFAEGVKTSWRMNYCCDGDYFADANYGEPKLMQSWFAFNFPKAGDRMDFLGLLLRNSWLELNDFSLQDGLAYGSVDLNMPIPGTDGEILNLESVAFNLRMQVNAPIPLS